MVFKSLKAHKLFFILGCKRCTVLVLSVCDLMVRRVDHPVDNRLRVITLEPSAVLQLIYRTYNHFIFVS